MSAMAGWQVDVEVVVLRLLSTGELAHRWVRGTATPELSPDERAVQLAQCTQGLCHSTSWRQERPGVLVLTYASLPDLCPDEPAEPLGAPLVVSSGQPLHPSPQRLRSSHVAAHAVRHLADLALRDPVVRALADRDRPLWSAVTRTADRAQDSVPRAAS